MSAHQAIPDSSSSDPTLEGPDATPLPASPYTPAQLADLWESSRDLLGTLHYHSLFKDSPFALCEMDFSEVQSYCRTLMGDKATSLEKVWSRHPEYLHAAVDKLHLIDINNRALELFQVASAEAFEKNLAGFFTPDSYAAFGEAFRDIFNGQPGYHSETSFHTANEETIRVRLDLHIPGSGRDAVGRVYLSMVDLTPQWNLNQQRQRYQERLRALVYSMAQTEQTERQQLAGALHDDIGQVLLLSKLKVGELFAMENLADIRAAAEEIRKLLDQSISSVRALTTNISPPILYDLGFEAATESLGQQLAREHHIAFRYMTDHEPKPMSTELRSLLFQCVRELFHNIVQHANASHMELAVLRDQDWVKVLVNDNGQGRDAHLASIALEHQDCFGLFNIRERIQYIGGRFEVDSSPGQGMRVSLAVPLESTREDAGLSKPSSAA